jgi:hypothetical protein
LEGAEAAVNLSFIIVFKKPDASYTSRLF